MKRYILKLLSQNKFVRNFIINKDINKQIEKRNNTFPDAVIIESTNICNADCYMCPSASKVEKKIVMDFGLYKKIVDNCARLKIKGVCLHNIGEPFVDPGIAEKVRYAKDMGIETVWFFSNASLLDKEKSRSIIESGLDKIAFSLDGFTKETYQKIRQGLDFEKVISNIEYFMHLRKELGRAYPKVKISFTISEINRHEKDNFYNYWKEKVDEVACSEQFVWPETYIAGKSFSGKGFPCWWLWNFLVILADGRAVPCCYDYKGRYCFGNLKDDDLEDIWGGEKINQMRRIHLKKKFSQLSLCKNCYQATNFSTWFTIKNKELIDRV